jgi:hypothetical protein
VLGDVASSSETGLYTQIELTTCERRGPVADEVGNDFDPGRMSGRPVFAVRELFLELIGIVEEYARGYDLLRMCSLSSVNAKGQIAGPV